MAIDSRSVREMLSMTLALGLCFGTGCQGDEGDGDGGDAGMPDDGADTSQQSDTNQSNDTTGAPTEDDPTTSEDDGMDGPGSDGADDESTGNEGELDPNLDRSAPNILNDPDLCGYPGPGEFGYGGLIDQSRFPNFVLEDCNGEQREFAEFFCHRDDINDFNKVFIVVMEAVW